ncbi:MAG: HD domain-containing protein [Halobacteria archaeon]
MEKGNSYYGEDGFYDGDGDREVTAIKDAVHDHIEIGGFALDLLDTPVMQRLRHVRQLGTAYLVYPSANHTRFEHSLGVYHLAVQALDNLDVSGVERDEVRAAALLHDVGHTPFSHSIEELVYRETGLWHDDVLDVLDGEAGDILEREGLDVEKVAGLIKGEGKWGQLISGELDVDRMDYLVRDAHHTGVPYGAIDTRRLVLELEFRDGELVLGEGNVQTAESLLLARALMHPTVYNHHVARISMAMLVRATERLIDGGVSPERVRRMDDHELIVAIRESDETGDLGRRLRDRRLYKRAVWESPYDMNPSEDTDLERAIAERAGVSESKVILDGSQPPEMVETGASVVNDGVVRKLENCSSLVSTLKQVQKDQWNVGVYTPENQVDTVRQASMDLLGLE